MRHPILQEQTEATENFPSVASCSSSENLTPSHSVAANGDGHSAASAAIHRVRTDGPLLLSPAGGGNVRTSHLPEDGSRRAEVRPLKGTIIDHACQIVVKELMALHGEDIPCARKFQRYLKTLSLSDLHERRDRFLAERVPMQLALGRVLLKPEPTHVGRCRKVL